MNPTPSRVPPRVLHFEALARLWNYSPPPNRPGDICAYRRSVKLRSAQPICAARLRNNELHRSDDWLTPYSAQISVSQPNHQPAQSICTPPSQEHDDCSVSLTGDTSMSLICLRRQSTPSQSPGPGDSQHPTNKPPKCRWRSASSSSATVFAPGTSDRRAAHSNHSAASGRSWSASPAPDGHPPSRVGPTTAQDTRRSANYSRTFSTFTRTWRPKPIFSAAAGLSATWRLRWSMTFTVTVRLVTMLVTDR